MNQDFRDLLHELCEAEAQFLIVGAYALAFHGAPRATGDIDVWVQPSPDNAAKVMRALRSFGAPLVDLTEQDLATPGVVFQVGLPPRRIDILTRISGVEFAAAWQNKKPALFGDVSCFVIGAEDMIINKRAAGRPKDLVDVDVLQKLLQARP